MQFEIEKKDNGFIVLNNKKPLENHRNIEFNPFKQEIAQLLCDDLNEIFDSGRNELIKSFVYCVLSTFSNYEKDQDFESNFELTTCIQWDLVYRIPGGNPLLHHLQKNAIKPLIAFLDNDYDDLSPNYAQSIEDMKDLEIEFVSEKLVKRITDLYCTFNPYQLFTVDLLFKFYNQSSISLPILWVTNKISSTELQYASTYFEGEKETNQFNIEETELLNFYIKRLNNLKLLLELNK
jgi:hypothetical protein